MSNLFSSIIGMAWSLLAMITISFLWSDEYDMTKLRAWFILFIVWLTITFSGTFGTIALLYTVFQW